MYFRCLKFASQTSMLKKGSKLLEGKYTIIEEIGHGANGVAYIAKTNLEGEKVIIKTIFNPKDPSRDLNERCQEFMIEAEKLKKCSIPAHANIVKVYELFKTEVTDDEVTDKGIELPFIVQEFIKGETLEQYVIKNGPMQEEEAFECIKQISNALDRVHEKDLIHRDVKPNNIMLRFENGHPNGEAVLLDFGLAINYVSGVEQPQNPSGDKKFMPIEQYEKLTILGPYTDIYSLAATFFYVLTSEKPDNCVERINPKNKDYLKQAKKINNNISEIINQGIIIGMEGKPHNRPQSIQEWLSILKGESQGSASERVSELKVPTEYAKLQALLCQKKLWEANTETINIILDSCDRTNKWLRKKDIEQIPSDVLRTINYLWVVASGGKFGFSVQKYKWDQCGNPTKLDVESWKNFLTQLGWFTEYPETASQTRRRLEEAQKRGLEILPDGYLPNLNGVLDLERLNIVQKSIYLVESTVEFGLTGSFLISDILQYIGDCNIYSYYP